MFLAVTLFLPVWRYFIDPKYWEGLKVVPILLLANMSLGIYYNLSIWYKLTNKTMAGATITFIGVAITFAVNYFFIPRYSYMASAWATFLCYFSMMVISYVWGQKDYYVPYAWKKLLAYMIVSLLLFFAHYELSRLLESTVLRRLSWALHLFSHSCYLLQKLKKGSLPNCLT